MRTILSIAIVFVVAGVVRPGQADNSRAIVLNGIKAQGGEAKLAKLNSLTMKQKGTYYGIGNGIPYTGISYYESPDKFRMEIEGAFTVVLNGSKVWKQEGGATKELGDDEVALQIQSHRAGLVTRLLPLKDKAFKLKSLGEAKIDDQAARGVQVTRKDYPEVKLYFAKKSGLLIKSEYRTKSQEENFQEVTQATYYSDYRGVKGAKVPFKIVIKRDGKDYVEAEITEVKAGKVDAKLFAMPASN